MTYKFDDPLTQKSAVELLGLLARREISSEELVRAHLDRIITLDGKIRAFVDLLRGTALADARRVDEARARGDALGPLAGLPVSVKENLDFEGRAVTLGIVARKNRISSRDATIIRTLRRTGAVIVGRTNVPQLLLSHETRNPLFGATINPWSQGHAPGGSSGGEAASLVAGMSVLGIGTDIGGSIRVPAHFSGIAGFKPSLDRWSNRGSNGALIGQEGIRSQSGPMARSVEDLILFFEAMDPRWMAEDDPLVSPAAPRSVRDVDVRGLRVGVYVDDGLVHPSIAVGRAIFEAKAALERAGLQTTTFSPPAMRDAMALYFGLMSADGGETAFGQLEGSAIEPTLAPLKRIGSLPAPIKSALARGLRGAGEERAAWFLGVIGGRSVASLWALTKRARDYRLRFLEAMRAQGVDLLLCPAHATPAVPHGESAQFQLAGSPSMLFNLMQFPAGVVPVTLVRDDEAMRPAGGDRFDRTARKVDEKSAGLPVGVQLAGAPFDDERVLGAMLALERALGPNHPVTPRHPAF
ncbi:MAG: amidase [Polyangiaceae bacterium]